MLGISGRYILYGLCSVMLHNTIFAFPQAFCDDGKRNALNRKRKNIKQHNFIVDLTIDKQRYGLEFMRALSANIADALLVIQPDML